MTRSDERAAEHAAHVAALTATLANIDEVRRRPQPPPQIVPLPRKQPKLRVIIGGRSNG
jgi:hypothetical protein